jgi:hypothetical protein
MAAGVGSQGTFSEQSNIKRLKWRLLDRYETDFSGYYEICGGVFDTLETNNWKLATYLPSDLQIKIGERSKIRRNAEVSINLEDVSRMDIRNEPIAVTRFMP